jgi:hypothetical protein
MRYSHPRQFDHHAAVGMYLKRPDMTIARIARVYGVDEKAIRDAITKACVARADCEVSDRDFRLLLAQMGPNDLGLYLGCSVDHIHSRAFELEHGRKAA